MSDKDHRKVADHVLKTAHKVVTTERGNQHGGAEDSFAMIAALWQTFLQNRNRDRFEVDGRIVVTSYDVAQMMTLLKIARAVHGDPRNEDHYVDAAGYTGLAAAIAGVQTPETKVETQAMAALARNLAPVSGDTGITHKHTEIAGEKK